LLNTEIALRDSEERKRQTLEDEYRDFEKDYNQILNRRNELNINIERLVGEKRNTENAIKRADESILSITNSIAKRKDDIEFASAETAKIETSLETLLNKLTELDSVKTTLNNQLGEIESRYQTLRGEVNNKESSLRVLRKEREAVSETIHNMDMTIRELDIKSVNLIDHIKENYSLTLEKKDFDDLLTFDFKQRSEEVSELKTKIKILVRLISLLILNMRKKEKDLNSFISREMI